MSSPSFWSQKKEQLSSRCNAEFQTCQASQKERNHAANKSIEANTSVFVDGGKLTEKEKQQNAQTATAIHQGYSLNPNNQ